MALDERLHSECASWIAQQLMEDFGGFVIGEVIEGIMELEDGIREEHSDPQMDHATMSRHLLGKLEADGVPVGGFGQVNEAFLVEILHWEDEFLGLAGARRTTR